MTNARKKGELSKTAQSCVKKMLKEQIFDVRTVFSSKYTDKGLIMEDMAIDLVAAKYDYMSLEKNEEHFQNEFLTGTPDVITDGVVRDIKCSWNVETFPLFEDEIPNKDYYWQLMGYMALTGARTAYLDYVLTDTPEYLIQRELESMAYRMGTDSLPPNAVEEVRKNMTYSSSPLDVTIKTFEVEWSDEAYEQVMDRIIELRAWSERLISDQNINLKIG